MPASALIMVHNHLSGDPTPSRADIEMTRHVREAGEKLGLTLHDHIIISDGGHRSFKEVGLLLGGAARSTNPWQGLMLGMSSMGWRSRS